MKRKNSHNNFYRIKKISHYPFLGEMIKEWKPRAKKIDYKLKTLATDAQILPQHLSKLITGFCDNPKLDTINAIEMALREAEKKAGVR